MSKILYACTRHSSTNNIDISKFRKVCEEINPDNISCHETKFYFEKHLAYGISNPSSTINLTGPSVLLGKLFEEDANWNSFNSTGLDGNYGIFRANDNFVEIITDCMGTRNIWYYFDNDLFIASTSQKALINYLGNFEFDERVIPWIISTGSLGPSYYWDKRLKRIPADGNVLLNRTDWKISVSGKPVKFNIQSIPWRKQKFLLKNALKKTFENIDINFKTWTITLSGGHDSRAILLLLRKMHPSAKFNTTTWGTSESEFNKDSDAWIAKKLAKKIGTNHTYYYTEVSQIPAEKMIQRFLNNGEGRIDHITGYLDGFKIWKDIYENEIDGVIRGDEIFGYNSIYSPAVVNNFMGLTLCSEFSNLSKYNYIIGLVQEIPENLQQKPDESLPTWRDRIFQLYRIPFIQSALADLKYPYVEQINPFLSRRIVSVMRKMPDSSRTDKKLFKAVMESYATNIPFSKVDSNASMKMVLQQKEYVDLITEELTSDYAKGLFPNDFLEQVVKNLTTNKSTKKKKTGFANYLKSLVPKKIKIYIAHKSVSLHLNENILGFRILIICKMHRMLSGRL